MLYSSKYDLVLTGTDFGELKNYPKATYLDGYFFSDLFGDTNITYANTITGNIFLSAATDSYISSLPGLLVWLDTSDRSKILTGTMTGVSGITALMDKSPSQRLFKANTVIELTNWPLSGGYYNTNYAAHLRSTNYFYNSTFCLTLTSPFTLIFVWKDVSEVPGDTYPLCLLTEYSNLTSEIVLINNYESSRSLWGFRESTYGIIMTGIPFKDNKEHYFTWTHVGGEPLALSSQNLEIFNSPFSAVDFYYISGGQPLEAKATTIGSLCGLDVNSFIFAEMLLFNRVVSGGELIDIKNAISEKWNFYSKYIENVSFSTTITGGVLSSTSYEDFSLLTSRVTIPMQSCVTLLSINLSAFDITVSDISKVLCEFNDEVKEISSSLEIVDTDIQPVLIDNKIEIVLYPDKVNHVGTYNVMLSVYRFDSTVNKFILSGNILKCNVLDYLSNNKLVDTQIMSNPKDVLVLNENYDKKLLFLNKLIVDSPSQLLTGGDIQDLINTDVISPEDEVILLSDLLNDGVQVEQELRVPIIPPLPRPRINPILPS